MKIKYLGTLCMALLLSVGVFSTTAFAYAGGAEETEPTPTPAEEVVEEPMEPLTPDGNMTLVDDEGNTPEAGKQFITVVTKTGNYFYLIIDRDDEGKETVHFLNHVDEADLMELIDEEELEQINPIEETMPTPTLKAESELNVETEASEPETEPQKNLNVFPAIVTVVLFAAGGGFYLWKKFKEKKSKKTQEQPDPDADYVDDVDYGYQENKGMEEDMDDFDEGNDTVI